MKKNMYKILSLVVAIVLAIGLMTMSVDAESAQPAADSSPAIYVYQKNAASVVGIITSSQTWNPGTREVVDQPISQGSGIVFAEGGYVVTNNHVIDGGDSFQVLLPDGEKVDATLIGKDSSTDIAVLQVEGDRASEMIPVELGSSEELLIGSTVVAIGNPGGEVLSNTVTQGIVSALERTSVTARNASRSISYIQHDAAINSGNSGGGLFNYKGQLVGINTLKYSGSAYSMTSYEGLGFAIPVETIQKVAGDLIEYGKVQRAQLGVIVGTYSYGPEEPMSNFAPSGVYVTDITKDGPADLAGMQTYDCIYSVNGVRVKTMIELTTELDKYNDGDTVTVQVVRYGTIEPVDVADSGSNLGGYYNYFFGGSSSHTEFSVSGGYDIVDLDVTLKVLD